MTDQDQERESPSFYQHHYKGKQHMYSGRLPDRKEVNMSLVDLLTHYNDRVGSFHFYLFLRDGTQLSILSECPDSSTISIAQIVHGILTEKPIFIDHVNYDSHGEMTLSIFDLPGLIAEWQGGL